MEHPVRLAILARLDEEPQTLSRLSAGIGNDELPVRYHVQKLESSRLVEEAGDGEDGQTLYVARLEHRPCWVAELTRCHNSAPTYPQNSRREGGSQERSRPIPEGG